MPYDARGLMPLLATSPFAVWHYRTTDSRTAVLAPGYFNAAAGQLRPGHLVILQAADSMTFLPVREAGAVGDGVVLDTAAPLLQATRSVSVRFGVNGTATAILRAIEIDALPNPSLVEDTLTVEATVRGASRELRFTLLNAAGAVVSGPVTAAVSSGRAAAELAAPPAGDGYRLRAADADDASLARTSSPFSIARPGTGGVPTNRLITEQSSMLRAESGDRLLF